MWYDYSARYTNHLSFLSPVNSGLQFYLKTVDNITLWGHTLYSEQHI